MAEEELGRAGEQLEGCIATFRDGEMLPELAAALVDLAEQRRADGRMADANEACNEAIDIAGPRELV
ncbi:MAG: hypothetical protein LC790_05980, partial [Actinobacteria bacterium]|nr:hypothetical protein [Actinomycetota bacterium]